MQFGSKGMFRREYCLHPSQGRNPVTGEQNHISCNLARNRLFSECGPDGELFEQKPPAPPTFWQQVKEMLRAKN